MSNVVQERIEVFRERIRLKNNIHFKKHYYKNKQLECIVPYNKDKKIHGVIKFYSETGELNIETLRHNGTLKATREFYATGQIKALSIFKGDSHGHFVGRMFYKSGQLSSVCCSNLFYTVGFVFYATGEMRSRVRLHKTRGGYLRIYNKKGELKKQVRLRNLDDFHDYFENCRKINEKRRKRIHGKTS